MNAIMFGIFTNSHNLQGDTKFMEDGGLALTYPLQIHTKTARKNLHGH